MYLVHARFRIASPAGVPDLLTELARQSLRVDDGVEHLSVHPHPPHQFTLGFYLLSQSLRDAEDHARRVCIRLLADAHWLPPTRLLSVGVPLAPPALLDE
ncbi:hypothetical protein [Streptomyces mutabilis]|uniref:Uncharacterized protein n=1 Tax=Streptomyces mutabilis TaxID=67332 RepID=A0A086MQJ2_9ACTN|nr:hypothetical protein [Streptomyces mutabilis]KFG71160.1 hypothetical protein FM21_35955 [Streptomyces mutabilis]